MDVREKVENEKRLEEMTKYIKKDELLKFKADVYDEDGHVLYAVPTGYIVAMPPADVIQVRHGRWIDGDPYCPICKKDKFRGLDADIWADWQPDYCPNCGADMSGSNDE